MQRVRSTLSRTLFVTRPLTYLKIIFGSITFCYRTYELNGRKIKMKIKFQASDRPKEF